MPDLIGIKGWRIGQKINPGGNPATVDDDGRAPP